ncbi:unnamed protein product, partial [Didymodactylos carnosus]
FLRIIKLNITGIIDWEWAGSYPCSEEYFLSYFGDADLKPYFYEQLELLNIETPRTIKNFHFIQLLYDLKSNIAPWFLRELANPDQQNDLVQLKLNESKTIVKQIVDELKTYSGTMPIA